MKLGEVLKKERERRGISIAAMARHLGVAEKKYAHIESGESELEFYGTLVLSFAEKIDQPVSNLYYPCGLPFSRIKNYDVRVM